jgi:hypothetical protein
MSFGEETYQPAPHLDVTLGEIYGFEGDLEMRVTFALQNVSAQLDDLRRLLNKVSVHGTESCKRIDALEQGAPPPKRLTYEERKERELGNPKRTAKEQQEAIDRFRAWSDEEWQACVDRMFKSGAGIKPLGGGDWSKDRG